jgi:cell division protease FtsH
VIDEEVEKVLRQSEEKCRALLEEHRNGLDLVARSLLEHETIDGAEVERLVDLGLQGSKPADVFGDKEPSNGGPGTEHTEQIPAATTARMRKS